MFADIETAIVDRLKAKLPAGVHVGTLDELEEVKDMRQKAPAAWVIYDGHRIGARVDNVPAVAQVVQEWFVVVTAKSARGAGRAKEAKAQASSLSTAVLGALLGFHLGGGKYLRVEEAPGPEYDGGYCHVPLAFSNAATFKAQP
jgi:phage gp37-like protein